MYNFEFIDFFTTNKNTTTHTSLEEIMKEEISYKHTVYINFIDFISDIYKSCHFNVEDLERQVSVDIDRSNIFINETNIRKQEKSKWFLQYVKQNHRTNYIKILCLHNQSIYGQVLELLMGIINDPEIILADEPTGSLDLNTAKEIFKILKNLKKSNRLIIFATHNRFFANKADCLLEMTNGSVKTINV